jgi:hypothetical protein
LALSGDSGVATFNRSLVLTFVAYQPILEDAILPKPDTILKAILDLKAY